MQYTLLTGSVNSAIFAEFVRSLPASRPIILDNCAIHKTQAVRALCAEKHIDLLFTPPYCPWYNPVEFAFSEIKAAYRPMRLGTTDFVEDVHACVARLDHYASYFRHARSKWALDRASMGA